MFSARAAQRICLPVCLTKANDNRNFATRKKAQHDKEAVRRHRISCTWEWYSENPSWRWLPEHLPKLDEATHSEGQECLSFPSAAWSCYRIWGNPPGIDHWKPVSPSWKNVVSRERKEWWMIRTRREEWKREKVPWHRKSLVLKTLKPERMLTSHWVHQISAAKNLHLELREGNIDAPRMSLNEWERNWFDGLWPSPPH